MSLSCEGMTCTKYLLPCYAFNLATEIIYVFRFTKKINIVLFDHFLNIKIDMPQLIVKESLLLPQNNLMLYCKSQFLLTSLQKSPALSKSLIPTSYPKINQCHLWFQKLSKTVSTLHYRNNCQFYPPVKESSLFNVSSTDQH